MSSPQAGRCRHQYVKLYLPAAGNLRCLRVAASLPLPLASRTKTTTVFPLFRQLPSKVLGKTAASVLPFPPRVPLPFHIGLGGRSCRAHTFYSRAAALLWATGDRVAFTFGHGKRYLRTLAPVTNVIYLLYAMNTIRCLGVTNSQSTQLPRLKLMGEFEDVVLYSIQLARLRR